MLRSCCAIAALAALAVASSPAQAKHYRVASSLGGALDTTRAKTKLAILLPNRIALDYDGRVYASGRGTRSSYVLYLAGAPGCGSSTVCLLASFSARRGGSPSYRTKVRLRGGRSGYFRPLRCGASCSPPAIQWRSRGNLYRISARVPDSTNARARRRLVTAANAAIGAGRR